MASTTTIGDSQETAVQPIVSAIILGVVTQAELEDKTDAHNIALYSGKKLGACYIMIPTAGGSDIVVATGSTDVADWDRVSDAGAVPITPA